MLKLQMTGVSSVFYEESDGIVYRYSYDPTNSCRNLLLNKALESFIHKTPREDMKWGILEQHAYSGNLGTSLLKAIIKGETLEYNSTVRTIVPTS